MLSSEVRKLVQLIFEVGCPSKRVRIPQMEVWAVLAVIPPVCKYCQLMVALCLLNQNLKNLFNCSLHSFNIWF